MRDWLTAVVVYYLQARKELVLGQAELLMNHAGLANSCSGLTQTFMLVILYYQYGHTEPVPTGSSASVRT